MAGPTTRLSDPVESETPDAAAEPPLGDQLKSLFDAVASSPMPERLSKLVDELEEKYRNGELRPDPKN